MEFKSFDVHTNSTQTTPPRYMSKYGMSLTDGSERHGVESVEGAEALRRLKVRHCLLRGFTKDVQGLQHLHVHIGRGRKKKIIIITNNRTAT